MKTLARFATFLSLLATLSACSALESIYKPHGSKSQNSVDSIVQPESDMRNKVHRSQDRPDQVDETESEKEGNITNDNSA